MHSFSDCIMGVALGAAICGAQVAFGEVFDEWLTTKGWTGGYHLLCLPHQLPYHLTFQYYIHLCHGSPGHRHLARAVHGP